MKVYPSAATMMREEHGPAIPELARRMTVCSCHAAPARTLVPVLTRMPAHGIPLGDKAAPPRNSPPHTEDRGNGRRELPRSASTAPTRRILALQCASILVPHDHRHIMQKSARGQGPEVIPADWYYSEFSDSGL